MLTVSDSQSQLQSAPGISPETPQTASKKRLLADFVTCAICQNVMNHPYTIVDCMHKLDRDCLSEWWKQSTSCPICKTPSTKALHDFVLQGMIDSTDSDSRPTQNAKIVDNAPIFPSPTLLLGPSRGFDNDPFGFGTRNTEQDDNWDDDNDEIMQVDDEDITARISFLPAHETLRPGGSLIFPCESCPPGNSTGYECDWPIPMPTAEEIQLETQRTGRMIRAPRIDELKAPLLLAHDIPGSMNHLQCEGCTLYVPREYPANIRCTVCRMVYCGEYARKPNCGSISLHSMDALVYKGDTAQELAMDSFPQFVRMNREEVSRFEQYLTSHNISVPMILRQLVEAREATFELDEEDQFSTNSQGAAKKNPWTDAVLCTTCIDALVRVQSGVWNWWLQERARAPLDPAVRVLPNCWYGWECRTQAKSFPLPTHASKFNPPYPEDRQYLNQTTSPDKSQLFDEDEGNLAFREPNTSHDQLQGRVLENRAFETMEKAIEALLKDSKVFADAVVTLLESGAKFSSVFAGLFQPGVGEYDLVGQHPDAGKTVKSVDGYATAMQELRDTLSPELELISSRIIVPSKEFQGVMKTIRKNITKREHKLVDYDRYNNNLNKLREKKDKSLNDEKNLFKLEQDFDVATQEYDAVNTALKTELPQFMVLATQFIDPLFHSFYYMQLNIYYLMMEKLQGFATEAKYTYDVAGQDILNDYQHRRGDVWERVDSLTINKRVASTAMRMAQRQNTAGSGLSRATTSASTASAASGSSGFKKAPPPPPPGSSSVAGGFKKMPPPAPPGSFAAKRAPLPPAAASAPPPPYTQGNSPAAAVAAATKRPPPPPPTKATKPIIPKPTYVIAMYDFTAQADGDLDFKSGDKIEVITRTPSTEDWWKGRLNGREGVFPGNYVQDA